jgi:hypothetical protein
LRRLRRNRSKKRRAENAERAKERANFHEASPC